MLTTPLKSHFQVHAAVLATCSPGDTVVLARNCHQSAFLACVLAGTRTYRPNTRLHEPIETPVDLI
jgi:arginine/lysine/ornithine decarboxylase